MATELRRKTQALSFSLTSEIRRSKLDRKIVADSLIGPGSRVSTAIIMMMMIIIITYFTQYLNARGWSELYSSAYGRETPVSLIFTPSFTRSVSCLWLDRRSDVRCRPGAHEQNVVRTDAHRLIRMHRCDGKWTELEVQWTGGSDRDVKSRDSVLPRSRLSFLTVFLCPGLGCCLGRHSKTG